MDFLMDIAEPGQSLKPHELAAAAALPRQRQRVVGIDLGTTYSLVAAIDLAGQPVCITDEEGRAALPSVVHYGADGTLLVGREAQEQALSQPQRTVSSAKRLMGRGLAELAAEEGGEQTPLQLLDGEGGMVSIAIGQRTLSPVEVSAEILKALKARAEEALDGPLHGAVVTVPAYFDDAQRQATKDAARLAGLEVLRLVNEPTAAALAYGLDNFQTGEGREGLFAIYDLGGGTFDISILRLNQGVFQVLATGGNSHLGGDDFDQRLVAYLLRESAQTQPTPHLLQACREEARRIKEALSAAESVAVALPLPDGTLLQRTIDRATFEGWIADLVNSTGVACRRALKDAGVRAADLQGVVLVGGSTRVPLVRRFVAQLFEREPLSDLDPDQVVALGAAHQASLLAGNSSAELLLLDVTPLSLGIETMGELVEKIIPRNTPIPTARAQEFTTFKDGQTAMAIHVLQGERELVSQCRSLARFELRGIPPLVAGAARIRVTFRVDADGLLTVSAQEETTRVEQSVAVKPSYGLSDGQIEQMLREALTHGEEDMRLRLLNEAKVEAERVLSAVGAALKQDSDLLSEQELKQVKAITLRLWETTQGEDPERINQMMSQLDKETAFFAQRRMDRSIQAAMTGRNIADFG
ncbi:MAG: Fe-S protein assembly chaperone HscA [Magnetococcales bacterium]|nr:Fe-S protein assembly chaperone HscA [Magnetococcales bacterium]